MPMMSQTGVRWKISSSWSIQKPRFYFIFFPENILCVEVQREKKPDALYSETELCLNRVGLIFPDFPSADSAGGNEIQNHFPAQFANPVPKKMTSKFPFMSFLKENCFCATLALFLIIFISLLQHLLPVWLSLGWSNGRLYETMTTMENS